MKPHGLLLGFTLLVCTVALLRVPDLQRAPEPTPTPAPEVAPPGRYWLRVQKSFSTEDGIVGFAPGTGLSEIGSGEYLADRGDFIQLKPSEVTNDLPEARKLAGYQAATRETHLRNLAAADAARAATAEAQEAARAQAEKDLAERANAARVPVVAKASPDQTGTIGPIGSVGNTHSVVRGPRRYYGSSYYSGTPSYWIDIYGRRHYQ